jgi:hypothetical protein
MREVGMLFLSYPAEGKEKMFAFVRSVPLPFFGFLLAREFSLGNFKIAIIVGE